MSDIDEALLIAWVDGELDEVTRRRVDRAVAEDPALGERLAAHLCLRARLSDHYAPIAREPAPEKLRALVEAEAKVAPLRRPATTRWRGWGLGGAIAASLVLGLCIGHFAGGSSGPIVLRNGAMVARGDLARALDSQLASAQDGGALRIGLSFRRKGGGWCRSFEGAALSGVACQGGAGWQVQQLGPGTGPQADYRQAGSSDARLLATIDALIDGAPANAAEERAAAKAGWK
jgi:anti-sigma factor RsiW